MWSKWSKQFKLWGYGRRFRVHVMLHLKESLFLTCPVYQTFSWTSDSLYNIQSDWIYWKVLVLAVFKNNIMENMILTLYLDKSHHVASWGGYVASTQVMSRVKLKHQASQQLLSHGKFIFSRDVSSCRVEVTLYRDCKTDRYCNINILV